MGRIGNQSWLIRTFLLELAAIVFLLITAPLWFPIALLVLSLGAALIVAIAVIGIAIALIVIYDIPSWILFAIGFAAFIFYEVKSNK
jgi:hypothetical protein